MQHRSRILQTPQTPTVIHPFSSSPKSLLPPVDTSSFAIPSVLPISNINNNYKKLRPRCLKYFQSLRRTKRSISESRIVENSFDHRPYADILIAGLPIRGLMDSGAEISVLGAGAEQFIQQAGIRMYNKSSSLSTASGEAQPIIGYIRARVSFCGKHHMFRFFVAPGLTQKLYLGVDFWHLFNIRPQMIDSLSLKTPPLRVIQKEHSLSSTEADRLRSVIESFPSFSKEGLGKTHLLSHSIDVIPSKSSTKQRFYPVSPAIEKLLFEEIDRMLNLGVIEECPASEWNNPVTLVSKKNGKKRFCLDARHLNSLTVKDAYGLPIIDGLLSRLSETHFISAIDLKDAFWQIPLHPSSRPKTAFTVPGRPLYQFTVMPFGLCNAPQTMCRLMDKVIPHQLHDRVFVYLDDLLVISSTLEEHFALLEEVASRLREAKLTVNVEKSNYCLTSTRYLGYVVGGGCLRVDPEKVEAVSSFPIPKTTRQVRRFLGMSGWYSRFIPNYASLASPLTDIIGKKKFLWSQSCQNAFDDIKTKLTTAPVLTHANFSKKFYIQCDASKSGVGSVIFQRDDEGYDHPIAFYSKKLNRCQRNYSVTELECYAAVLSVKKFRAYIEGYEFEIITDHSSLQWLMQQKDLSGRLARWSLKLQGFNFTIEHRKGKDNIVPDALSRTFSAEELYVRCNEIYLEDNAFLDSKYLDLVEKVKNHAGKTNMIVRDGKVYIRTDSGPNDDSPVFRLYVPDSLVDQILENGHDTPLASHLGAEKTYDRLRRLYFWPQMFKSVQNYVKKCDICRKIKAPNFVTRPPMGQFEIPTVPFQQLYVDFLGPYPRSKNGFCYIMVLLDHLTKFPIIEPLHRITSETAIKTLKRFIHLFGIPEKLISDNGPQFISKTFGSFLSKLNIRHIFTAKYSPQANASERLIRTLLAAIRAYLPSDQTNWDLHLHEIGCALRSALHSSIGTSPFRALFGRHMITDGAQYELMRELECLGENDVELITPETNFEKIKSEVLQCLKIASEKQAHQYNLRSNNRTFKIGQTVFVRNFVQSDAAKKFSAKLAPKFIKAIIDTKVGNVAFRCKDESGHDIGVYHLKDIHSSL